MTERSIRVLMICTGNICRSPLAECVLRHKALQRGVKHRLLIDSAGVGDWHVGEPPDYRVRKVAALNGVDMTGSARQITPGDLKRFDWLLCMDQSHLDHIVKMGAERAKVSLLLDFNPNSSVQDVPDPYYGGIEGFHEIFRMIDEACEHVLKRLLSETA